MAISNLQETLLMYTKQKAMINMRLSNVMFDITAAAREEAELQDKYNQRERYYYHSYNMPNGDEGIQDEYNEVMEQLLKEHEYDLANLQAWESELELDKNNYETRLNIISQYESSWTKLLSTNIKNDFSYGGAQQG